jgi:hypothetical protein
VSPKKIPGPVDAPEFLFATLAAQRRSIVRQHQLLVAAHDALCDEVAVLSRRPNPRARTVTVLGRLAKYLNRTEKKKEDPDA